jgi:hypothetical protein
MNTYAVWPNSDGVSPVNIPTQFTRPWLAPYSGEYTLLLSADNYAGVSVDGTPIGSYSDYATTGTFTFSAYQGTRLLGISATNGGGPAGVAAVIKDSNGNIIWTTRDVLDPGSGENGGATIVSGSFGTIYVTGGNSGGSAYQSPAYNNSGWGDGGGGQDGDGGDCFLTTATVSALGMADNCEELRLARMLRDDIMTDDNGRTASELYYKLAPKIVERKENWDDFYSETIVPLTDLIKNKEYDLAIQLYKLSTLNLIDKHITHYSDTEVIETIYDAMTRSNNNGAPYCVKYFAVKSYLKYKALKYEVIRRINRNKV